MPSYGLVIALLLGAALWALIGWSLIQIAGLLGG